ncbi:MAG: hypothetical protein VZQ80_08560, partial [Lachnospiraceae bacterium]|nr:hypothetical protein [Lachnospiraceae bacterium]
KVFSEQIKEKGRTREAVEAAIRICVDRNVLREYLKQHEGEGRVVQWTTSFRPTGAKRRNNYDDVIV